MRVTDYDDCWLRYDRVEDEDLLESYRSRCLHAYVSDQAPELGAVRDELRFGIEGLLGREPHIWQHAPRSAGGFLTIGRYENMQPIHESISEETVSEIDDDGYLIRSVEWEGDDCVIVTAPTDRGLVYGTFHLLRLMGTGQSIEELDIVEEPANAERMINHWDDPFQQRIERGYGGQSIFDWERLPDLRDRYFDYARLLASVGINGVVLNNVNTGSVSRPGGNDATAEKAAWQLLESDNLEKVAAMASVFRRYGIRTSISVNYASPMLIGDLDTADPLDPEVEDWWKRKADEIYDRIPDFAGFLVKADVEGEPGPYDYDRDHAEGANVLARALEPHGGRVWWRAFVYGSHEDRAVQAYETFKPLDGEFDDNVTVQIKNGPVDFQPREPVSSLFGAMPETNLGCELMITQEYTGQGVHTCYQVPMWKEILDFDTYAEGEGTPVKDVLGGSDGQGIAGVCNIGEDPNWTGHYLSQANLYGYGRLIWDPDLGSETIAEEWISQTFGDDPEVMETVRGILLGSWDPIIDYITGGLGLLHLKGGGSGLEGHYEPGPERWPEYHGATEDGIGVDRSSRGNGYATQYHGPVAERYDSLETCPEELLLFFHHVPWTHELQDGTTVVQRLYDNCFAGVEAAKRLREQWHSLEGDIDEKRYRHVSARFDEQVRHAAHWRDTLCSFFYENSGIPDEHGRVDTA